MGEERPRFGPYEALFELAAGGMATVLVARKAGPAGFERLAVLKRVHRHLLRDREFFDMLRDEARVASLIVHSNVVSVDDVVEVDGELLLAQPYVESVPLSALLRAARDAGERLPPAVVVRILTDVLAGLHAAHEARDMRGEPLHVVHRDVSPHNVLTGTDGRSRLIDFGIAKAERRVTHTKTGVMKGKLSYMAPEALRQAPLDRRADVFAAGVMLHEALTGRRLFDGQDEADLLLSVMVQEIEAPSLIEPSLPPELDAAVLRALERRPDERTGTAADLAEALERAVSPAPPREVAAIVERLCARRLSSLRASLREALDRQPGIDLSPTRVEAAPAAVIAGPRVAEQTERAPSRGRTPRPWLIAGMVFGALIGIAAAVGFLFGERRDPSAELPGTSAALSMSSAPGAATAVFTAQLASALPSAPPATSTGAAAVSAPSVPSPRAAPPPRKTAELHRNPYVTP